MPVRLYAHRGAAAEQPENTLPSFRRAMELGAHALETDVHLTRDGHVVVAHDPDGLRQANVRARIAACTLAEVQAWDVGWGFTRAGERPFAGRGIGIPTFEALLAEFPGIVVNVDLKPDSPALVDAFLALVRRRGDEERVIAASFHKANLVRLRALGYQGLTALAQAEVVELLALPPFVWRRLPFRGQAAQLPTRAYGLPLAHPRVIARCRAVGVRVDYWTINDPAEARRLIALGVDGLMTDDPAVIAPVVRAAPGA